MKADNFIFELEKTSFKTKQNLPKYPGIYYVVDDNNQDILYIGQSVNINSRWLGRGHHRDHQLITIMRNRKTTLTIYSEYVKIEFLDIIEQKRINEYSPLLNESPVKRRNISPSEELLIESLKILQENVLILGIEKPRKDIAHTLDSFDKKYNLVQSSIVDLSTIHLLIFSDDYNNFFPMRKHLLKFLLKRNKQSKYSKQWSRINHGERTICHRLISNGYVFQLTEWWYWKDAINNELTYEDFYKQITTIEVNLAGINFKALNQNSFYLITPNDKKITPIYYLLTRLKPYELDIINITNFQSEQKSLKHSFETKVKKEIEREITKVLTRINTLTSLFSQLRSLIIGEYFIGETKYIVIAVNNNDYSIFYTSMSKGKKGWFKDCISYNFEGKEYLKNITKYQVENYVIEFVEFFQIINYMTLNNRLKQIQTKSLFGVEIKALNSVDFLEQLLKDASANIIKSDNNFWFTREKIIEEGSYILYLKDKLKPLENDHIKSHSSIKSNTVNILINDTFRDIDSLLTSRGKMTEINTNNLIRKSGFIRQSGNRKYLPFFVSSFTLQGKYMLNNSIKIVTKEQEIKLSNPNHCNIVYQIASGDEKLWLLLGDELKDFVKLGILENIKDKECYTDKLYFSTRRYVHSARLTIKIKSINYSGSLPFGFSEKYPFYQTAITEIEQRIKSLNIPTLSYSFTQENVKS